MAKEIKGFKGFDKDLRCRGFQYEIGKEYVHDGNISPCNSGFHFCEHPLSVFNYYAPATSRYCTVAPDGKMEKDGDKTACEKIKIVAELSLSGLVDAAVKFVFERAKWTKKDTATGTRGAASATGFQGAASATGFQGAASATGTRGAASATGTRGAASATGFQGAASATSFQGAASATGFQGAASATGTRGAASATGFQGAASATGEYSIACALGYQCKAKGALNCWIVLAERNDDGSIREVKAVKVDGKKIKPETWYQLVKGKVKAV